METLEFIVEGIKLIFDATQFTFEPPLQIRGARRILIKPCADCSMPYPRTTSRECLAAIIAGIRNVSSANIILIEGSLSEESVQDIYG